MPMVWKAVGADDAEVAHRVSHRDATQRLDGVVVQLSYKTRDTNTVVCGSTIASVQSAVCALKDVYANQNCALRLRVGERTSMFVCDNRMKAYQGTQLMAANTLLATMWSNVDAVNLNAITRDDGKGYDTWRVGNAVIRWESTVLATVWNKCIGSDITLRTSPDNLSDVHDVHALVKNGLPGPRRRITPHDRFTSVVMQLTTKTPHARLPPALRRLACSILCNVITRFNGPETVPSPAALLSSFNTFQHKIGDVVDMDESADEKAKESTDTLRDRVWTLMTQSIQLNNHATVEAAFAASVEAFMNHPRVKEFDVDMESLSMVVPKDGNTWTCTFLPNHGDPVCLGPNEASTETKVRRIFETPDLSTALQGAMDNPVFTRSRHNRDPTALVQHADIMSSNALHFPGDVYTIDDADVSPEDARAHIYAAIDDDNSTLINDACAAESVEWDPIITGAHSDILVNVDAIIPAGVEPTTLDECDALTKFALQYTLVRLGWNLSKDKPITPIKSEIMRLFTTERTVKHDGVIRALDNVCPGQMDVSECHGDCWMGMTIRVTGTQVRNGRKNVPYVGDFFISLTRYQATSTHGDFVAPCDNTQLCYELFDWDTVIAEFNGDFEVRTTTKASDGLVRVQSASVHNCTQFNLTLPDSIVGANVKPRASEARVLSNIVAGEKHGLLEMVLKVDPRHLLASMPVSDDDTQLRRRLLGELDGANQQAALMIAMSTLGGATVFMRTPCGHGKSYTCNRVKAALLRRDHNILIIDATVRQQLAREKTIENEKIMNELYTCPVNLLRRADNSGPKRVMCYMEKGDIAYAGNPLDVSIVEVAITSPVKCMKWIIDLLGGADSRRQVALFVDEIDEMADNLTGSAIHGRTSEGNMMLRILLAISSTVILASADATIDLAQRIQHFGEFDHDADAALAVSDPILANYRTQLLTNWDLSLAGDAAMPRWAEGDMDDRVHMRGHSNTLLFTGKFVFITMNDPFFVGFTHVIMHPSRAEADQALETCIAKGNKVFVAEPSVASCVRGGAAATKTIINYCDQDDGVPVYMPDARLSKEDVSMFTAEEEEEKKHDDDVVVVATVAMDVDQTSAAAGATVFTAASSSNKRRVDTLDPNSDAEAKRRAHELAYIAQQARLDVWHVRAYVPAELYHYFANLKQGGDADKELFTLDMMGEHAPPPRPNAIGRVLVITAATVKNNELLRYCLTNNRLAIFEFCQVVFSTVCFSHGADVSAPVDKAAPTDYVWVTMNPNLISVGTAMQLSQRPRQVTSGELHMRVGGAASDWRGASKADMPASTRFSEQILKHAAIAMRDPSTPPSKEFMDVLATHSLNFDTMPQGKVNEAMEVSEDSAERTADIDAQKEDAHTYATNRIIYEKSASAQAARIRAQEDACLRLCMKEFADGGAFGASADSQMRMFNLARDAKRRNHNVFMKNIMAIIREHNTPISIMRPTRSSPKTGDVGDEPSWLLEDEKEEGAPKRKGRGKAKPKGDDVVKPSGGGRPNAKKDEANKLVTDPARAMKRAKMLAECGQVCDLSPTALQAWARLSGMSAKRSNKKQTESDVAEEKNADDDEVADKKKALSVGEGRNAGYMLIKDHGNLRRWQACISDAPPPVDADATDIEKTNALVEWMKSNLYKSVFEMMVTLMDMLCMPLSSKRAWLEQWATAPDGVLNGPKLYRMIRKLALESVAKRHVALNRDPQLQGLKSASTKADTRILYSRDVSLARALGKLAEHVGVHADIKHIFTKESKSKLARRVAVVMAFPNDVDPDDSEWMDACSDLAESAWDIVAPVNKPDAGFGITLLVEGGIVLETDTFCTFAMSKTMADVKKVVLHVVHGLAHNANYNPHPDFALKDADIAYIRDACTEQWPNFKSVDIVECACGLKLKPPTPTQMADDEFAVCGAWPIGRCDVTKTMDIARVPVFTKSTLFNVLTPNVIRDAFESWVAAAKATAPSASALYFADRPRSDKAAKMHHQPAL
jgi:hypothetical protein